MRRIKVQYIEGSVMALIGIVICILSMQVKKNPQDVVPGTSAAVSFLVEAKFTPLILGVLAIILGIAVAVEKKPSPEYLIFKGLGGFVKSGGFRVLVFILIMVLFVSLIKVVDFWLAVFVFLLLATLYLNIKNGLNVKKALMIAAIALAGTLVIAWGIPKALNIYLP